MCVYIIQRRVSAPREATDALHQSEKGYKVISEQFKGLSVSTLNVYIFDNKGKKDKKEYDSMTVFAKCPMLKALYK